ncbi:hypothetical protein B0H19DRAFT_435477 [Mycena capillaripes]|nr:hypothetical protein B0H19DRAFT_435477 [Mycena capillaripes]
MSDPTAPPFTQSPKPNVFRDGHGTTWLRDADGQWVPVPSEASFPPPPLQPPFEISAPTTAQQAPSQRATYNFAANSSAPPHVSSFAQAVPPHLIDPRLVPLPSSHDRDLSEPHDIAKASLRPAVKVGGVRQKDKGKKRQLTSDSSDDSDDAGPAPKRGRPQGSSNYNKQDTKKFLKTVKKLLPIGANGWKGVTTSFNK